LIACTDTLSRKLPYPTLLSTLTGAPPGASYDAQASLRLLDVYSFKNVIEVSREDKAVVAPTLLVHPIQHRIHIDYAHSIILGRNKALYYLIIVIDSIDFTRAQPSPNRSQPEDLIHDFMTLTGIEVGHIRAGGAGEFARSATFKAYCTRHNIVIEEVPAYTHTFNARAEGAIRICKDKVRAFLQRANMPRRFWPDALLHWCRTYAHWPDASGHAAWEKLDELGPHSL
jgi:hypothetical protein